MTTTLMKCVLVLFVSVCVASCLSGPAYALHPASDYNKYKDKEWFKDYITGVGEGFSWANATLINAGKDPLYCQAENLKMTPDIYADILRREIAEQAKGQLKDVPIEMLLLAGLARMFPCKEGKP